MANSSRFYISNKRRGTGLVLLWVGKGLVGVGRVVVLENEKSLVQKCLFGKYALDVLHVFKGYGLNRLNTNLLPALCILCGHSLHGECTKHVYCNHQYMF